MSPTAQPRHEPEDVGLTRSTPVQLTRAMPS